MDIETKKVKTALVVRVKGKLDAVTTPDFEKALLGFIANGEQQIVVNFADLEYVSSAGLRSVLVAAKQAKLRKAQLMFAGLQGLVLEGFKLSGFISILAVAATETEGLERLGITAE